MMDLLGLAVAIGPATLLVTALLLIARLLGLVEWPRWRRRRRLLDGAPAQPTVVPRAAARPAS